MVSHFQKLFDVTSLSGVYPRMNEVYSRLGETSNTMRNLRDVLQLGNLSFTRSSVCAGPLDGSQTVVCGCVSDSRVPPAEVVNRVARLVSSTEHTARLQDVLGDADIDRLTCTEHTHVVGSVVFLLGHIHPNRSCFPESSSK